MNGVEFQEVGHGDLVRVCKGEEAHEGRWVENGIFGYIPNVAINWDSAQSDGWTLAVIEKAKPKLPEEPGCYIDSFGAIWRLTQEGRWHVAKQRAELLEPWEAEMLIEDPVRLEPVAETAWRVLDRVRLTYSTDDPTYWANLDKVAAHFGVTS